MTEPVTPPEGAPATAVVTPEPEAAPAAPESTRDPAGRFAPKEGDAPESFDRDYVEKLRRENAGYRTRASEAETRLQEIADAEKSETQRAAERAEAAEARAVKAEQDLARARVARRHGLPDELAARLVGTTEEELAADAETLSQHLKPSEPGAGLPSVPRGATAEPPLDQQIAEAEAKSDWATAGALKAQKLAASTT